MPIDPFSDYGIAPNAPYSNALEVTPSDTEDLPVIPRGVSSRTGGRLRVTFLNDEVVELRLNPSEVHPFRVKRIHATGSTQDGYAQGVFLFW